MNDFAQLAGGASPTITESQESRAKNNPEKDKLDEICSRFDDGVNEVELMFDILPRLESDKDKDKVLRAQLVLLVGTLDFFVHEIFTYGLLQILDGRGNWRNSKKGEGDQKSQGDLNTSLKYMDVKFGIIYDLHVNHKNKKLSLEKMSELLYGIRTSPSNVTPSGIKNNLEMININIEDFPYYLFKGIKDLSDKRNGIVHNGGIDSGNGEVIELSESYIRDGIEMVKRTGEKIKDAVRRKDSGD